MSSAQPVSVLKPKYTLSALASGLQVLVQAVVATPPALSPARP